MQTWLLGEGPKPLPGVWGLSRGGRCLEEPLFGSDRICQSRGWERCDGNRGIFCPMKQCPVGSEHLQAWPRSCTLGLDTGLCLRDVCHPKCLSLCVPAAA